MYRLVVNIPPPTDIYVGFEKVYEGYHNIGLKHNGEEDSEQHELSQASKSSQQRNKKRVKEIASSSAVNKGKDVHDRSAARESSPASASSTQQPRQPKLSLLRCTPPDLSHAVRVMQQQSQCQVDCQQHMPNIKHQTTGLIMGTSFLPMERTCCLFLFAVPVSTSWLTLGTFLQGPKPDVSRQLFPDMLQSCTEGFDFYSAIFMFESQLDADAFFQQNHGRIYPQLQDMEEVEIIATTGGACCYLTFIENVTYGEVPAVSRRIDDSVIESPKRQDTKALRHGEKASEWHVIPTCPFCLERIDSQATGIVTHLHGWLSIFAWYEVPQANCCAACIAISRAGDATRIHSLNPSNQEEANAQRGDTAHSSMEISGSSILTNAGKQTLSSTPLTTPRQKNKDLTKNKHLDDKSIGRFVDSCSSIAYDACSVCGAQEGLWVCLVCGHLGCGRYARAHAKEHAIGNSNSMPAHRFCLEIASGRIWDYLGDVFVHRRLVQMVHQTDAFEVALPHPADPATASGRQLDDQTTAEDFLSMEFDVILTSQLDHQRHLYEERCKTAEAVVQEKIESKMKAIEESERRVSEMEEQEAQIERELAQARKGYQKALARKEETGQQLHLVQETNQALMDKNRMIEKQQQENKGENVQEDEVVKRLTEELEKLMKQLDDG